MLYEDAIDAISASTLLRIGSLGEDETILWHTNGGSIIAFRVGGVYVQLGTLAAADATLSFLLGNAHKRRSMPARASISRASARSSPICSAAARSSIEAPLRL
jgi:hypothetical protein